MSRSDNKASILAAEHRIGFHYSVDYGIKRGSATSAIGTGRGPVAPWGNTL